jgi:hypothetical protein
MGSPSATIWVTIGRLQSACSRISVKFKILGSELLPILRYFPRSPGRSA